MYTFDWDPVKNKTNLRKHGVDFNEAQSVFLDENAIEYYDPDHSESEDRFLMLGISWRLRVLVVCYCYRNGLIRIFSARKADHSEETTYWETAQ